MYQGMAGVPGASWALCVRNFMQKHCNWHFQFPVSLSCVKQLQFKSLLSDCLKRALLPFSNFAFNWKLLQIELSRLSWEMISPDKAVHSTAKETDRENRERCCFGVCKQTYYHHKSYLMLLKIKLVPFDITPHYKQVPVAQEHQATQ